MEREAPGGAQIPAVPSRRNGHEPSVSLERGLREGTDIEGARSRNTFPDPVRRALGGALADEMTFRPPEKGGFFMPDGRRPRSARYPTENRGRPADGDAPSGLLQGPEAEDRSCGRVRGTLSVFIYPNSKIPTGKKEYEEEKSG